MIVVYLGTLKTACWPLPSENNLDESNAQSIARANTVDKENIPHNSAVTPGDTTARKSVAEGETPVGAAAGIPTYVTTLDGNNSVFLSASLRSDFQQSREGKRVFSSASILKGTMEKYTRGTLFSGCKYIPDGLLERENNKIKGAIALELDYEDQNDPDFLAIWNSENGAALVRKTLNGKRSSVNTSMKNTVKGMYFA
jgi:hypothetical protein